MTLCHTYNCIMSPTHNHVAAVGIDGWASVPASCPGHGGDQMVHLCLVSRV